MRIVAAFILLVFSLLLLCFLFLNQERVTVTFFPGEKYRTQPLPLFVVIMCSVIFGLVMAGLLSFAEQVRLRMRTGRLARQVSRLEKELAALRPRREAPREPIDPEMDEAYPPL
jgi:uncharacterized integral membrane protein